MGPSGDQGVTGQPGPRGSIGHMGPKGRLHRCRLMLPIIILSESWEGSVGRLVFDIVGELCGNPSSNPTHGGFILSVNSSIPSSKQNRASL